jgi:hypothetical protein
MIVKARADLTRDSECMAQLEERHSGSNLNQVNEAAKLKAGSMFSSQSGRLG